MSSNDYGRVCRFTSGYRQELQANDPRFVHTVVVINKSGSIFQIQAAFVLRKESYWCVFSEHHDDSGVGVHVFPSDEVHSIQQYAGRATIEEDEPVTSLGSWSSEPMFTVVSWACNKLRPSIAPEDPRFHHSVLIIRDDGSVFHVRSAFAVKKKVGPITIICIVSKNVGMLYLEENENSYVIQYSYEIDIEDAP